MSVIAWAACRGRGLFAVCLAVWLAACVSPPVATDGLPLLRLSPASLGTRLALHQRLDVQARGQVHQLEVLLEADPSTVQLALFSLGRTVARLEWDGTDLVESTQPGWPAAVSGARILNDLQLMLWPVEAIQIALPSGWTLQTAPDTRELSQGGSPAVKVRFLGDRRSELVNLRDGYRILVESKPMEGTP